DSDEAYEQELIEQDRKMGSSLAQEDPEPTATEHTKEPIKPEDPPTRGPRPVPDEDDDYQAPVTPIKRVVQTREENAEVHNLRTIHPRSYNDAKLIGEAIRSDVPVIINVTDVDESEAKRLVDYSARPAFGTPGPIERVTHKAFLLSPTNAETVVEGHSSASHDEHFLDQA